MSSPAAALVVGALWDSETLDPLPLGACKTHRSFGVRHLYSVHATQDDMVFFWGKIYNDTRSTIIQNSNPNHHQIVITCGIFV